MNKVQHPKIQGDPCLKLAHRRSLPPFSPILQTRRIVYQLTFASRIIPKTKARKDKVDRRNAVQRNRRTTSTASDTKAAPIIA